MNTQMQDYMDDSEDTLSLCDLLIEDHTTIDLPNEDIHLSSKPNSSSSSSSSEQDFLGFFTEEWVRNSAENIVFCGKTVSSTPLLTDQNQETTKTQSNTSFRSNSDSFRYMRFKTAAKPSPSRSKSLPNSSVSPSSICKSRFLVFMFGSGSSKFPTKIDVSEIKSRQLRRQSTMASPSVNGGKEESGGRKNGNKGWWRVVDVLGCGGGYKKDTIGVLA